MMQPSLFDQVEPSGGRRGRCNGDFPKLSPYTGARAYTQVREFAETPPRTAPSAPHDDAPDPAAAYPTCASIKTAFDRWTDAGQPWPPPAGLTSAIASRLIPRAKQPRQKWR